MEEFKKARLHLQELRKQYSSLEDSGDCVLNQKVKIEKQYNTCILAAKAMFSK